MANGTERRKRRRARLWKKHKGKCHWCGCKTVLPEHTDYDLKAPMPHNLATFDHLDSRLSDERGKYPGQERSVLACWKCNNERGAEEHKALTPEEVRERAQRHRRRSLALNPGDHHV